MKTASQFGFLESGSLERLPKQDEKTGALYIGNMTDDALSCAFALVPAERYNERSPDYLVAVENRRTGKYARFGIAYARETRDGARYFNILFTHPRALPNGLWFNAWADDEQPKEGGDGSPYWYTVKRSAAKRPNPDPTNAADDFGVQGDAIAY